MTRPTPTGGSTSTPSGRTLALGLLGLAAVALAERLLAKAPPLEQPPSPDLPPADYASPPRPVHTEDSIIGALSQTMTSEVEQARATYGDEYADKIAESNRRLAAQALSQLQAGSQSLSQIAGNLRG